MAQQSLAFEPFAAVSVWTPQPLLDQRNEQRVAEVNLAFLDLMIRCATRRNGLPVLGLPAHLVTGLAELAPERRALAARLPFVLFDMRFRDDQGWRQWVTMAANVQDAPAEGGVDPALLSFSNKALLLAWSLCQMGEPMARLALGLGTSAHGALLSMPIAAFDHVAWRVARNVSARFPTREWFWRRVLEYARDPAPERAARVRLHGWQLHGLEAARAGQRCRARRPGT